MRRGKKEKDATRRRPVAHREESSWSPLRATLPPLVLSSRDPHATAIDDRVARGARKSYITPLSRRV